MPNDRYDVVVVGGGLAGSSLSIALARHGASVLMLEAEVLFRDRVRGEVLMPWGVAEARSLGIYDVLVEAGAPPLPYRDTYVGGELRSRRPFARESENGESPLAFQHASVQEALLRAAAEAGARVLRGARVRQLSSGCDPRVTFEIDGRVETASGGLVAGADGRASRILSLGGFEVSRGARGLMTAGVALSNVDVTQDAVAVAYDLRQGVSAALLPQGSGRARAYLTTSPGRPGQAAVQNLPRLIERLVAAGLPAAAFASASAAGPLATFDGTPKWVETPYRDGVVLIGDAASTSDPAWGQGMSLALRDVSVLTDAFTVSGDAAQAGYRYAAEHARYGATSRVVSRLVSLAQFGANSEARLLRSSPFWKASARRIKAMLLDGPDGGLGDLLLSGLPAGEIAAATPAQNPVTVPASTC